VKSLSGLHKRVLLAHTSHGAVQRTYWVKDSEVPSHRLATNQQTASVSPAQKIAVSYGMLFSKRANSEVAHAVDAISKTHLVPGNIHKIKTEVVGVLEDAHAEYHWKNSWTKESLIKISKYSTWSAASMVHEYGHYLDHHLFGDGGSKYTSYGTSGVRGKDGYIDPTPECRPLMRKLYNSQAAQSLMSNLSQQFKDHNKEKIAIYKYYLSPSEMFARAYAQYVGLRSSKLIHTQLHEMRKLYTEYGYHAQWEDKDFEPIAREFDRLFMKRKLLRSRG